MSGSLACDRIRRPTRVVALAMAGMISFSSMVQSASAAMIGTDAVAPVQADALQARDGAQARAHVLAAIDRAEVQQQLQRYGVDPQAARDRVNALSDAQARTLAAEIDKAPAGAGAWAWIGGILLILLITDLLGWTDVFPFIHQAR